MQSGNFVKVAKAADIPEGNMKTVDANGEQVLVANVKGKYYAIGAICKHEE
jgi:glycine betaine catabolism B